MPVKPEDKIPNQPKYYTMAQEALIKYVYDKEPSVAYNVLRVNKVTEKEIYGKEINLDFIAVAIKCKTFVCDGIIRCQAEILEFDWLKKKDITVKCSRVEL